MFLSIVSYPLLIMSSKRKEKKNRNRKKTENLCCRQKKRGVKYFSYRAEAYYNTRKKIQKKKIENKERMTKTT